MQRRPGPSLSSTVQFTVNATGQIQKNELSIQENEHLANVGRYNRIVLQE
jgi:hypothetical protein